MKAYGYPELAEVLRLLGLNGERLDPQSRQRVHLDVGSCLLILGGMEKSGDAPRYWARLEEAESKLR